MSADSAAGDVAGDATVTITVPEPDAAFLLDALDRAATDLDWRANKYPPTSQDPNTPRYRMKAVAGRIAEAARTHTPKENHA